MTQESKGILAKVKDEVIYSHLFLAFFVFSILLLLVASIFHVPGVADHPQFDNYTDTGLLQQLMHADGGDWLYYSFYAYFILDWIWPVLLLLVGYKIIKNRHLSDPDHFSRGLLKTTRVFMYLAYASDAVENGYYWCQFAYSHWL